MLEEQRCHQVPPVQCLEQIDGVEHRPLVRARQLLDERFDRRRVGDVGADGRGGNVARDDAGAKGAQVLPPRDERHADPEGGHDETRVTQLLPVEPESPRLNQRAGSPTPPPPSRIGPS